MVSPVFWKRRLASSERVCTGALMDKGWADSSPACGDRLVSSWDRSCALGISGDWGSETGRFWMARSTFLCVWRGDRAVSLRG